MDAFAERYFPVEGRTFISLSGTWLCELNAPVDVSGADRRIFWLHFSLIKPDLRWKGAFAIERTLELRTSLASFCGIGSVAEAAYVDWLRLVIKGFLDSNETNGVREAYEIERAGT